MSRIARLFRHLGSCWNPLADLRGLVGLPARRAALALPSTAVKAPAPSQRIEVLTGVRAWALLWVLAFHCTFLGVLGALVFPPLDEKTLPTQPRLEAAWLSSWANQPIVNGDLGVDVFFTLSGVLIATMWLREVKKKAGGFAYVRFISRRYLRLAPMLVVGILSQLLAGHLFGHLPDKLDACSKDWWKILLMVNNYTSTSRCLVQAWSVAVEFQLYLLAPALLWCAWDPVKFRPRRWWCLPLAAAWLSDPVIMIIIGASLNNDFNVYYRAFNMWGVSQLPLTYTATFTRSAPFVAGMAAALVVAECKQQQQQQQQQQGAAAVQAGKGADLAPQPTPPDTKAVGDQELLAVPCTASRSSGAPSSQDLTVQIPAEQGCSKTSPQPHAPLPRRRRWSMSRRWLLVCADAVALACVLVFTWLGGGENRNTYTLSVQLDYFVCIFGRPLFGAALAWLLGGMLLGRCRPLAALLSLRMWLPAAGLSYGAYLLQDVPLASLVTWQQAGVTTLYAGWAVYWFGFGYFLVLCLAIALPFFVLVEMPFQRMIKR